MNLKQHAFSQGFKPPVGGLGGALAGVLTGVAVFVAPSAGAFQRPDREPLPHMDKRPDAASRPNPSAEQTRAIAELRNRVPKAKVDFEPITGGPKFISAGDGFLSGLGGEGRAISPAAAAALGKDEPHRATKAFLHEHRKLFGHGPEALDKALVKREFATPHNDMKTVVWEQQVDGIPVFEAVLIAHTTARGELVNLSSQFVPDPEAAANRGTPARAAVVLAPVISVTQAVVLAARDLGENTGSATVKAVGAAAGVEKVQKFTAAFLRGECDAKLVWVPMERETLRLCWDVILTVRKRGEMYRALVDAQTGQVVIRRCLTEYMSDASYRVFTSDSPSPFSPGHSTPLTNQPPLVPRTLVTLPALDTNASPNGWIDDGVNETRGNNVDAHTDTDADNAPDLPRPAGSPFRVFDFPMDLTTQEPSAYRDASIVQLFYLCNWMHDKLYQLGFTEAAGNFQNNNFGRGGIGNDALQADAQDGGRVNNADMSVPPDGSPPRMQMFLFIGPTPHRDSALDTEIVLHEYTHGLSNRRVGGGIGLSALQSRGLGEGWSDWYSLALLSDPNDDANGNYAHGGYSTYEFFSPTFENNYYFGIRRYPYTTDMTKNPLTFKDIDSGQASAHSGVPISPRCCFGSPNEFHNQGELWCVTLWEARANLIAKHGFTTGNQLILQLVTDGMNLAPANPNFVQARDAIIQADLVATGGANRNELWAAFAKRGLGADATSPASFMTSGVQESFDLPDDLSIVPRTGFTASGPVGGPFSPGLLTFTLTNAGAALLNWTLVNTSSWLNASLTGGALTAGGPAAMVTVALNPSAASLSAGIYVANVRFTNLTSGFGVSRQFVLWVGQWDYLTELFDTNANDLAFSSLTFTPDGSASFYDVCQARVSDFPTDPVGGVVTLGDDNYVPITLPGENTVAIYNRRTNLIFIGSNGYLTMDAGDSEHLASLNRHFDRPRISALFRDLNPGAGGTVSLKYVFDRVAITFQNVPEYGFGGANSFQYELFFDGRIRLTYLGLSAQRGLAGLSGGQGVPPRFQESDLSSYASCVAPPIDLSIVPASGSTLIGPEGGPFCPDSLTFTLTNTGASPLHWTMASTSAWLSVSLTAGTLIPGGPPAVATLSLNDLANRLPTGAYSNTVRFTSLTSGFSAVRQIILRVVQTGAAPDPIWIPDFGPARPYPSTLGICGFTGTVTNVLVTLFGLSHGFASDIGILLVGPEGQSVVLMEGAGGSSYLNNVTLTFDDNAASFLPSAAPILTGSYRPTEALSVFSGTNPNGQWRLFVQDFESEDAGVIAGGWSLAFNGSGGSVPSTSLCRTFGTWASRTSRTSNALNDVAFGNGRFVAVGANFNIATSTNGVDWTNQFFQLAPAINSVTFGNGLFVAVGVDGWVGTSTNGTIWGGPSFTPAAHLNSVVWGNGTFVAVGTNGVIRTSPNGTNWTFRFSISGPINALAGVTYGNGRFVAVGTSGTVVVSIDGGTNWFGITGGIGTSANLADVTFGNGQFVAVGPVGTLFTSLDGLVWTARDPGTRADLNSITYGGGRFVAVGNSGSAENGIFMTSTDGLLWSTHRLPWTAWWNDVVFGRSNYVVVGERGAILQSGQRPYILSQPQNRIVCATDPVSFTFGVESGCPLAFQWQLNGTNLPGATNSNLSIAAVRVEDAGSYTAVASDGVDTLVSAPATLQVNLCRALDQWTQRAPPPGSNALNGVVCAPDWLVAVGNAGTILRSADKMSWLASTAGTNVTLSAVAHGGGTFVAVGFNGVILNSSNAADWTPRDSGTSRILRNIAHDGGRFVAVGDFGTVLSSPDGLAWTAQDLGTNRTLLGLTWANDRFVTVGPGGYVATSPDGATWTSHASGLTLTLYDVAYGNGTFVAVGNGGAITISTNGFDWTRQPPLATNRLLGVTWANGTFVAVGVGGLVLTSPDGISWTTRNSRTIQDLNDITYCGNAFVAVGANGTILVSGFSVPPMLSGRVASDHFELNLTAEIGLNYRVQASPSLPSTNWLDLFSFTSSWPVTTLRDMSATNAQQRFYRVVSP